MNLILVIEHGNKIRLHYQDVLKSSHLSLITVHDTITALQIAKSQHPDLIICDIFSPEFNCGEILQEMQKDAETINIPWIFINSQIQDHGKDNTENHQENNHGNHYLDPSKSTQSDEKEINEIFPALAKLQAIISSLPAKIKNNQIQEVESNNNNHNNHNHHNHHDHNSQEENEFEQLKSRFITMTSHEFRTPLAVISSSAEILKDFGHKLDEERKKRHLECIQIYVKQTTELLDNILLINQAEAKNLDFEPVNLEIVSFCQRLTEEVKLSAVNHNLIFASSQPIVNGNIDKKLLRQILINLLVNAVKFSHQNSTVNFNLDITDQNVIFTIQDQGIGIPPEDQVKLFQSFHRANNVGNIRGIGLGLSIVAKCVDLHKGTIAVNSQVGKGTIFTVKIPLN